MWSTRGTQRSRTRRRRSPPPAAPRPCMRAPSPRGYRRPASRRTRACLPRPRQRTAPRGACSGRRPRRRRRWGCSSDLPPVRGPPRRSRNLGIASSRRAATLSAQLTSVGSNLALGEQRLDAQERSAVGLAHPAEADHADADPRAHGPPSVSRTSGLTTCGGVCRRARRGRCRWRAHTAAACRRRWTRRRGGSRARRRGGAGDGRPAVARARSRPAPQLRPDRCPGRRAGRPGRRGRRGRR